jgi:hypothetical protein
MGTRRNAYSYSMKATGLELLVYLLAAQPKILTIPTLYPKNLLILLSNSVLR